MTRSALAALAVGRRSVDRRSRLALGIIVASALLAFAPCLFNAFVWDDKILILQAKAYWLPDLKAIFFGEANALEYLPVRDLTLVLDALLWGRNPVGFHSTNLLIYAATLPLVYHSVRRLAELAGQRDPVPIAFWTTLVFALHPLHAEPVNFVAARNNLLALFFVMLSLYALLRESPWRSGGLVVSLLAFALALWSKASVVFYPLFLVMLHLALPRARAGRRAALLALTGFVLLDVLAIATHIMNARASGIIATGIGRFGVANGAFALAKAAQIPWFYIGKLAFPYPLSVLYPPPVAETHVYLAGAAGAGGLAVLAAGVWWLRRHSVLPLLGFGWLILSLGPVLNLFPTYPVVADRYAYPGVLGFALLVGWAVAVLGRRRRAIRVGAAAIALAGAALAFAHSLVWRSDVSLFGAAYAAYPKEAASRYAEVLYDAGQTTEALRVAATGGASAAYQPSDLRGRIAARQGDFTAALGYFTQALRGGGNADQAVQLNVAETYARLGRPMDAIDHYLRVVENPGADPLDRHRRQAREGLARARAAVAARRADVLRNAREHPQDPAAQSAAAVFLHRLGEYEEAFGYYERARRLTPQRWEIWYDIGLVRAKAGAIDEALAAYKKALQLNPAHPDTLNHIAIAYAAKGDRRQAVAYYRRALQIDPGFVDAAFNLGRLYYRFGERDQAVKYLQLTKRLAVQDAGLQATVDAALANIR